MRFCAVISLCLLSLGGLLSCGLEAFYYIDYIPQSDYRDTSSTVNLPSSGTEGYSAYFNNFIIFYRIYTSGEFIETGDYLRENSTVRGTINSTLNSDFNGLYSLTDITSTSVNTSNLESTFGNRRYSLLTLENANINSVLGSGSLGQRLDIMFSPVAGTRPTLTLNGGAPYYLQRAVSNNGVNPPIEFNPKPNQELLNHPDLYNTTYINNNESADVATSNAADVRYTYICMYIAARGTSMEMPPRTIYSQPTFIGIFRLANSG